MKLFFLLTFRNENKEEFIKQKKKEKIQERKKEVEKQVEKEEQDKRALDEYKKWLVSLCICDNVRYNFTYAYALKCT